MKENVSKPEKYKLESKIDTYLIFDIPNVHDQMKMTIVHVQEFYWDWESRHLTYPVTLDIPYVHNQIHSIPNRCFTF